MQQVKRTTAKKKSTGTKWGNMRFLCLWCDKVAKIKPCGGEQIRGAKFHQFFWKCDQGCNSDGYISKQTFQAFDKVGKVFVE